ncbi:hypothetical protein JHK86_050658 [Glycine max]|nr:hypothetical protein JHK86_050658 [Glycine max]
MAKLEDLPIPNHDTLEAVYGELEETRRRFDVLWSKFVDLFGDSPEVIGRSPGRVNLIDKLKPRRFSPRTLSQSQKQKHLSPSPRRPVTVVSSTPSSSLGFVIAVGVRDHCDLVARRREYLYLGGLLSSGLSIHQLHSSSLR